MARIVNITRSNPLSRFSTVQPQAGNLFGALADMADAAYERIAPHAAEIMAERGAEYGRSLVQGKMVTGSPVVVPNGEPVRTDAVKTAPLDLGTLPNGEPVRGRKPGGIPVMDDPNDRLPVVKIGSGDPIVDGINETAQALGIDPVDLATAISYETAGTFDPTKRGPTTQWGQHRGLIQFGEPQAREHGVDWNDPIGSQLGANGAVASYLRKAGVKPGMGLLDVYSAINAGAPGLYNRSDANNGGAPGTVADKVNNQMAGHRRKAEALMGGKGGVSLVTATRDEPPTLIRTSAGTLEPRLYSPYSGPILQAYNAAAGVAYSSEMLNKAQDDMMAISQHYLLNPSGFGEAAKAYIDTQVSNAPAPFRSGLRSALETEARRRRDGIMDDRQRDIRNRANNSSSALVKRYSTQYAEALAAGSEDDALALRDQLDGVLRARESLPGVYWTPEQSENVFFEAEREAQSIRSRRDTEVRQEYKDQLDLILKAAKDGRHAADESVLNDPAVEALLPEEVAEARSFVTLRDNLPSFLQMSPDEQDAALERMRDDPVAAEFQVDVLNAAEEAAKANRAAWEDDAMGRAEAVLNEKPPALPDFTAEDPVAFVEALAARRDYANDLKERGFFEGTAFFSDAELAILKPLFSKLTEPEVRLALASAFVQGFGSDAIAALNEVDGDSITMYAGKLLARGGDKDVALEAMNGQTLLDGGAVRVEPGVVSAALPKTHRNALAELRRGEFITGEVLAFSRAILASRMNGTDTVDDEAATDAVNAALGQGKNRRGQTTGGIQQIMGKHTVLPPGMAGEDVEKSLALSLGVGLDSRSTRRNRRLGITLDREAWEAAGDGVPMSGKQPLKADQISQLRLIPYKENLYRLERHIGNTVGDVMNSNDEIYFFDLSQLIEEMR